MPVSQTPVSVEQQNVLGLEIAVHHLAVKVGQRRCNIRQDGRRIGHSERAGRFEEICRRLLGSA